MSKIVSNNDIMKMFMDIDELKENPNLSKNELEKAVIEKQNNIITTLSFLVYRQTRQYKKFPNYEDLVQEGFVGLIKAVQNFKWHMFPNFFVYSDQWIHHYVKRAASRFDVVFNPNKSRVIYTDLGDNDTEIDEGPEEILLQQERDESIIKVLDEFPEREREIVKKIFGLGGSAQETLREIGPQFNLTYERVRQIKNNVIVKLKKNSKLQEQIID